jgi:hypothetical protein
MSTENKPVPFLSDDQAYGDASPFYDNDPRDRRSVEFFRGVYEPELQRLRSLLDEARVALESLVSESSRHQLCDILSHPLKTDRHKYGETCPPLARIEAVLSKLQLTK